MSRKKPDMYDHLKGIGAHHDILQQLGMSSPDTPELEAAARAKINMMTRRELLDAWLTWNGIIHYTEQIYGLGIALFASPRAWR